MAIAFSVLLRFTGFYYCFGIFYFSYEHKSCRYKGVILKKNTIVLTSKFAKLDAIVITGSADVFKFDPILVTSRSRTSKTALLDVKDVLMNTFKSDTPIGTVTTASKKNISSGLIWVTTSVMTKLTSKSLMTTA